MTGKCTGFTHRNSLGQQHMSQLKIGILLRKLRQLFYIRLLQQFRLSYPVGKHFFICHAKIVFGVVRGYQSAADLLKIF